MQSVFIFLRRFVRDLPGMIFPGVRAQQASAQGTGFDANPPGRFPLRLQPSIILGAITLDCSQSFSAALRPCCPCMRRIFCGSGHKDWACCKLRCPSVDALRDHDGPSAADAKGRAVADRGSDNFRAGHGRFWLFEIVLAFTFDAFHLRLSPTTSASSSGTRWCNY